MLNNTNTHILPLEEYPSSREDSLVNLTILTEDGSSNKGMINHTEYRSTAQQADTRRISTLSWSVHITITAFGIRPYVLQSAPG